MVPPRFATGLHVHRVQEETFYVLEGACEWQISERVITARRGAYVFIPPGVAHGCRALERSHLLYITSSVYDPDDEGRIPHDDPSIGYDWTAGPPIK